MTETHQLPPSNINYLRVWIFTWLIRFETSGLACLNRFWRFSILLYLSFSRLVIFEFEMLQIPRIILLLFLDVWWVWSHCFFWLFYDIGSWYLHFQEMLTSVLHWWSMHWSSPFLSSFSDRTSSDRTVWAVFYDSSWSYTRLRWWFCSLCTSKKPSSIFLIVWSRSIWLWSISSCWLVSAENSRFTFHESFFKVCNDSTMVLLCPSQFTMQRFILFSHFLHLHFKWLFHWIDFSIKHQSLRFSSLINVFYLINCILQFSLNHISSTRKVL